MKELVIISGKGGTGKTSLTAALASLAVNNGSKNSLVCVDCDVDAADLHLLLNPEIREETDFTGGLVASIDSEICLGCDQCRDLCRFGAIDEEYRVDRFRCEGCGVCHDHCPVRAVSLTRRMAGQYFVSATDYGPLIHARLGIAQENSGKLVAQVRRQAREIAEKNNSDLILTDGSPGIGCPVISSITGCDQVLVVTEPTVSGLHDLNRVLELTRHFNVRTAVCINKCDLNETVSRQIKSDCAAKGVPLLGEIPFDPEITHAMVAGLPLPEYDSAGEACLAISAIWRSLADSLNLS